MKNENKYELIKFEDGDFSLDVNVSPTEDTVWLTQEQIAKLFQKAKSTINEHIKKILNSSELFEKDCVRKFGKTELSTKPTYYYNLDMILAVGYRINSFRGILFRRWSSSILKQYLLHGQVINEGRCLAHADSIFQMNNTINNMNDRFIVIDDELYNIGSSIKDIGKKISQISKLESININELLNRYIQVQQWGELKNE